MAVAGSFLLCLLAACATALVNPPPLPDSDDDFIITRNRLSKIDDDDYNYNARLRANSVDLNTTENVVTLKRQESVSMSSMYVQGVRQRARAKAAKQQGIVSRLGVRILPHASYRLSDR